MTVLCYPQNLIRCTISQFSAHFDLDILLHLLQITMDTRSAYWTASIWFNTVRCVTLCVVECKPLYIEGILPEGPYQPCLRMADRVLLAVYHRYVGMCAIKGISGLDKYIKPTLLRIHYRDRYLLRTRPRTVWDRYNAVDFLQNPHNRHPIAHLWGQDI